MRNPLCGLSQAMNIEPRKRDRRWIATGGSGVIGEAHSHGGVGAIGQADDEIRIRTPPDAHDRDLLAKQRMMRMGDGDLFRRVLERRGSVLWAFRP